MCTLGQPWHVVLSSAGTVHGAYNLPSLTCLLWSLHLNTKSKPSNLVVTVFLKKKKLFGIPHIKTVEKQILIRFVISHCLLGYLSTISRPCNGSPRNRGSIPGTDRIFLSCWQCLCWLWAHLASCSSGTRDLYLVVKRPRCEPDHLHPSTVQFTTDCGWNSTLL
jgi:hypothetical protein